MAVVSMKQLLEAGVHFGHQTRRWNPKMAKYIFTERNGIYIIDLQKTVKKLDEAYNYVKEVAAEGGDILFVGTKKQAQESIRDEALRCGMHYVNARWLGGMMECKKALTEADGNFEKAIEILRERGLATAAKKASRVAAEGMVYADYCPACKVGVVIEVNAETDFVAKNDKFVDFVKEATKVIMKQNPADVEALMACKTEAGETVDEALKNLILVIKENIKVRRFTRYEGVCSAYVHGGGTHGILVNFETTNDIDAKDEFVAYGKDIAMQVAAANPGYVDEASVPAEVVAKEKEIMLAQMAQDPKTANKPEAVKEKMIEGKIKKFFKENCLVDQEFVKDGDLTVAQYTAKVAKDLGGEIKIVKFVRFVKGEGLEKRADDFASEVASMVK